MHSGGTFVPRATIYNAGFAYSGTITVDFYLSTNSIISIYDTLVGTRTYSSKAPNTYFYAQPTLTVPTSLTPRVYYVGAIFRTPLLEYNENDNTMVLEERLTVV